MIHLTPTQRRKREAYLKSTLNLSRVYFSLAGGLVRVYGQRSSGEWIPEAIDSFENRRGLQ